MTELINGQTVKELKKFVKNKPCKNCNGNGYLSSLDPTATCPWCGGTGKDSDKTVLALLDALEDARGREKDLERIFDSERQARADDRGKYLRAQQAAEAAHNQAVVEGDIARRDRDAAEQDRDRLQAEVERLTGEPIRVVSTGGACQCCGQPEGSMCSCSRTVARAEAAEARVRELEEALRLVCRNEASDKPAPGHCGHCDGTGADVCGKFGEASDV